MKNFGGVRIRGVCDKEGEVFFVVSFVASFVEGFELLERLKFYRIRSDSRPSLKAEVRVCDNEIIAPSASTGPNVSYNNDPELKIIADRI